MCVIGAFREAGGGGGDVENRFSEDGKGGVEKEVVVLGTLWKQWPYGDFIFTHLSFGMFVNREGGLCVSITRVVTIVSGS